MRRRSLRQLALIVPTLVLVPCAAMAGANDDVKTFDSPEGKVTLTSGQSEQIIPKDAPATLADADSDGDGFISQDEASASVAVTSDWIRLDRNKDGRISQAEFDSWD